MTLRTLFRILAAYTVALLLICVSLVLGVSLDLEGAPRERICSIWLEGRRIAREVSPSDCSAEFRKKAAISGAQLMEEVVVDEGPILKIHPLVFAWSIVSGRDGIKAQYQGRTAYLTPSDLLARQLYDRGPGVSAIEFQVGVDVEKVLVGLGDELQIPPEEVLQKAKVTRFASHRKFLTGESGAVPSIGPDQVTVATLTASVGAAAHYLVRNQKPDGLFRYSVDAVTNEELPGYNWPRHAGTTLFLAEAARFLEEPAVAQAARQGATVLREQFTGPCGAEVCVGDEPVVNVGSSSLALLAYVEIVDSGIDPGFSGSVRQLAQFLRSQQRGDGEFRHFYDRNQRRSIDQQVPYYSGEAALALFRAFRVTHDPKDLDGAARAVDYLGRRHWQFFGNRYYYAEEHWTCQAAGELWESHPNPQALDLCLRWQAFNRACQLENYPGLPFDGGFGFGPFVQPRMAPVGSRVEAAVPTLIAAQAAGIDPVALGNLDSQIRRSLALVMRTQFIPGPTHLMGAPAVMNGGVPTSPVDLKIRIDMPQHVGSAMIRYARYLSQSARVSHAGGAGN